MILAAICLCIGIIVFLFRSPTIPEWGDETFTHWVYAKLEGDPNQAEEAQLALIEMAPRAIPFLLHEMSQTDAKIAPAVNSFLVKLPWDIQLPYRDSERERESALKGFQALGSLGKPAVPQLEKLLFKEDNAYYAALALVEVNGEESLPILCQALTNRNPAISRAASEAVFVLRTNAEPALPILLQLSRSTNRDVAIAALWSLGRVGTNQPQKVLPTLQAALSGWAPDDLYAPLYALADLGPGARPVVPELLSHLTNSGSRNYPAHRNTRLAVKCLVQVLKEEAVPHFIDALKGADGILLQSVISQLGELGTNAAPAVPALVSIVESQTNEPKTKEELQSLRTLFITLEALARIESHPEMVVPVLTNKLTHSEDLISAQSALALGCFGKEASAAVSLLSQLAGTSRAYGELPEWMRDRLGLRPRERREAYQLALENIDPQAAAAVRKRVEGR
ncbi:MAG: HEAT repeat domain-containing protein [Limisphaerales bacterium]